GLPSVMGLLRLVRIANHRRPDVLQGWMYHGNLAASLSAWVGARTLPVIWNVRHSLADPRVERRSTRALLALSARLSRRTAAIVYTSRTSAREHERVVFAPEPAVHVPNGCDCKLFRPDPARRELLRRQFGIGAEGVLVGMVARCH